MAGFFKPAIYFGKLRFAREDSNRERGRENTVFSRGGEQAGAKATAVENRGVLKEFFVKK